MDWWQALVLGLIEGITEYLPVSSTGHLLLAERAMGIAQTEASDAFAICIQAGAIVAVLGIYRQHVWRMARGLAGKDAPGLQLFLNLLAGFFPAVIAGLALEKPIKKYLFGGEAWGLWPVIAAWLVGGIAILVVGWRRRAGQADEQPGFGLESLTWKTALLIGACQCLAMWPGTSRSLVTIVGGILIGLRMSAAVEFSFLLGVLTLSAATAHDGLKHGGEMIETFGWSATVIGFVAAWLSAVLAVRWMVRYLNRRGLGIFGYYRIALALVVAALILAGWMSSRGAA